MSRSRSTRRHFLKTTGAVASATLFSGPLLDFLGVTGDAFAATVRPNIKNLTATSPTIVSYKKGIAAMQALAAGNAFNWNNFANIHGIGPAPPPPSPASPLWSTCQHGSWWFLPWHRMYLWFFERAIRHYSGDASFALPYWDYTDPTQRALPSMFRTPTTGNPLYIPQRNSTINAGGQLPSSAVTYANAFTYTNFTGPTGTAASFGSQELSAPNHAASPHGQLETTPHDSVHGAIGGYMGSFSTAARDPIFWLHHSNIDRLWDLWLTTGGGRADVNNKTWCDQRFTFPDAGLTPPANATRAVNSVINALAQLGYSYQGVPAVPTQKCGPFVSPLAGVEVMDVAARTVLLKAQPMTLGDKPMAITVSVPKSAAPRAIAAMRSTTRALVLRIEGIDVTAPPGVFYEVYVGLPAGAKPDPKTPNYVGNLTTFGAEMHHGEFVAEFRISGAAQKAINENGGSLGVTFVPRGVLDAQGREVAIKLEGRVSFKQVRLIEE